MNTIFLVITATAIVGLTIKSRAACRLLPWLALVALLLVGAVALGLSPDLSWLAMAR